MSSCEYFFSCFFAVVLVLAAGLVKEVHAQKQKNMCLSQRVHTELTNSAQTVWIGCHAGFYGKNCRTRCAPGWYGSDCTKQCGECFDCRCNSFTGSCRIGCDPGSESILCPTHCPDDFRTGHWCPSGKSSILHSCRPSISADCFGGLGLMTTKKEPNSTLPAALDVSPSSGNPLSRVNDKTSDVVFVTVIVIVSWGTVVLILTSVFLTVHYTRLGRYLHVRKVFHKLCSEERAATLRAKRNNSVLRQRVCRLDSNPHLDTKLLSKAERNMMIQELDRLLGPDESYEDFVDSNRYKELRLAVANRIWSLAEAKKRPIPDQSGSLADVISRWTVMFQRRPSSATDVTVKKVNEKTILKKKVSGIKKGWLASKSEQDKATNHTSHKGNVRFSNAASVMVIPNQSTPSSSTSTLQGFFLDEAEVEAKGGVNEALVMISEMTMPKMPKKKADNDADTSPSNVDVSLDFNVDPPEEGQKHLSLDRLLQLEQGRATFMEDEDASASEPAPMDEELAPLRHKDSMVIRSFTTNRANNPLGSSVDRSLYRAVRRQSRKMSAFMHTRCCGCLRAPVIECQLQTPNASSMAITFSNSSDVCMPYIPEQAL